MAIRGSLVDFSETLNPASDRTLSTVDIPLAGRVPVSISVSTTVATQRGQTFVRIALADSAGNERAVLAQDYVTVAAPLGWPGGRIASPTEGPGAIRSIMGTDPGAGVEISETVPMNARWRIISIRATLLTAAVTINRSVLWVLDDGTFSFYTMYPGSTQPASSRYDYFLTPAAFRGFAGFNDFFVPAPIGTVLRAGHRIRTQTESLQAGDNWEAPQLQVEEWIDL
jgi:hypothetical protein